MARKRNYSSKQRYEVNKNQRVRMVYASIGGERRGLYQVVPLIRKGGYAS